MPRDTKARRRVEPIDVTREYLDAATPGQGTITYDDSYKKGRHKGEIRIAEWMYNTFDGDIHVLDDREYTDVSPDYQRNGKLWELKEPSTKTATDNAVKKALKQIYKNPGGLILDYGDHDISDEILEVIRRRIERSGISEVDVIFLRKGDLEAILRHKNEDR